METLSDPGHKPHANGYSSGGGGGGSGGGLPFTVTTLPKENLTYTWSNMNVFTRTEHRQNRIINLVQNIIHRDRTHQRKHILKNGKLLIHIFQCYC